MSGPYGYGSYGGYAGSPAGYGFPPAQRPMVPGQPPPAGYQPRPGAPGYPPVAGPQGYQPGGYAPVPGYGMPGYRPPQTTQPQTYVQPSRPAPGPPGGQFTSPICSVPNSFPAVQAMSKEELEKIVDSDAALVEYFEGRDDIKRLQEIRSEMVAKNESLATENLSLKPQLEEKQQELIELYAELEAKRNELNDLQQQRQKLADHYAPHNILARLKIAASEAEEESEAISENFLNGDISIDEFLKTFIPKKTICHSRRAKEEKMEKIGI